MGNSCRNWRNSALGEPDILNSWAANESNSDVGRLISCEAMGDGAGERHVSEIRVYQSLITHILEISMACWLPNLKGRYLPS